MKQQESSTILFNVNTIYDKYRFSISVIMIQLEMVNSIRIIKTLLTTNKKTMM